MLRIDLVTERTGGARLGTDGSGGVGLQTSGVDGPLECHVVGRGTKRREVLVGRKLQGNVIQHAALRAAVQIEAIPAGAILAATEAEVTQ